MDTFLRVLVIGIMLGGIYGLVAMGLNLIFGVVRVVNFAHGELVMLGMYGAYIAHRFLGLNVYATVVLVVPALFVVGLIIQRLLIQPLRDEPVMQLLATFGLLLFLQNIVLAVTDGTIKSISFAPAKETFGVFSVRVDYGRLVILVLTAVLTGVMWFILNRTRSGYAVRAVIEDRDSARLMGINVERVMLVVFGAGSAMAGLAGVLLAPVYGITPTVGQNFIFAAFTVVVLGGLGSVTGALFAGLIVGIVESVSGYYLDPSLGTAAYFAMFLVVLLVRPAGMFGRAGSEKLGV